jgi:hypothetical protein
MVTASIAGTQFGSGGLKYGLPFAQDLRLIRTRPEKSDGCDYRGKQDYLDEVQKKANLYAQLRLPKHLHP